MDKRIIVDKENMCIDRSTELGKYFDAWQKDTDESESESEKEFKSLVASYVEAALVLKGTMPSDKADEAISKLTGKLVKDINHANE